MKKNKKKSKQNNKVATTIGATNYVDHSMSILDRINELVEKKFAGKQIELARILGKKESQISKWLNGVQNYTLFTIAQLEEAFGEPIIAICTSDETHSTFVQVYPSSLNIEKTLQITEAGELQESKKYVTIDFQLSEENKPQLV